MVSLNNFTLLLFSTNAFCLIFSRSSFWISEKCPPYKQVHLEATYIGCPYYMWIKMCLLQSSSILKNLVLFNEWSITESVFSIVSNCLSRVIKSWAISTRSIKSSISSYFSWVISSNKIIRSSIICLCITMRI